MRLKQARRISARVEQIAPQQVVALLLCQLPDDVIAAPPGGTLSRVDALHKTV